jgi:hypothetical protein
MSSSNSTLDNLSFYACFHFFVSASFPIKAPSQRTRQSHLIGFLAAKSMDWSTPSQAASPLLMQS